MSGQTVDLRVAEIALGRADGHSFERFAQNFWGALQGSDFVPVGGTKDGGADGFEADLFEDGTATKFLQASIQADPIPKIRRTIKRLIEVGRQPKTLFYLTNMVVPNPDQEEDRLSDELSVRFVIRDHKYIISQINSSLGTIQSYKSYIEQFASFLSEIGSARTMGVSAHLPVRSLCVFLGQELERRRGNTQILESVTDSLIIWSLEGTDPDKDIFMSRAEILEKVLSAIPAAGQFIRGELDNRLATLTAKGGSDGREVRWYKREDKFCLPFETREIVSVENIEDEKLRAEVSDEFRLRIAKRLSEDDGAILLETCTKVIHRTLELAFEQQGVEMSYFLNEDDVDDDVTPAISDHLRAAVVEFGISGNLGPKVAELCLPVLREALYEASDKEREYLGKMSRTYMMLFMLQNEPKVVEYFRNMSAEFILYIGADLIIRSISEYYLESDNKHTVNAINILKAAGASLILTEKTLEEVWTHIEAQDYEFTNHYMSVEPYVDMDLARQIDRILIRAYFYARLDPALRKRRPAGWRGHLEQFLSYKDLHTARGKDQLRKYLITEFGFHFETEDEMSAGVDADELADLASRILTERSAKSGGDILSQNSALQVLRVYKKREEMREENHSNPYGFRTWWVTDRPAVRRATGPEISKYHARFMMRLEFLLNFIAYSPSAENVRKSFGNVFPAMLGIRLSSRLDEAVFKQMMDGASEVFKVNESRAGVILGEMSNRLKSDFFKQYYRSDN